MDKTMVFAAGTKGSSWAAPPADAHKHKHVHKEKHTLQLGQYPVTGTRTHRCPGGAGNPGAMPGLA